MRFLPPAIVAAGVAVSAMMVLVSQTPASAHMSPRVPVPWGPPAWHPNAELLVDLPNLDGDAVSSRAPVALGSRSVFVYDVDAGQVLYARNADDRRSVASLTKLVSALALASEEDADLEAEHCIDHRFRPSQNGARSKFSTGECYQGWDLAGAALVASDNRGAFGMQVASGLDYDEFIGRMNEVTGDLQMGSSSFVDPSGLEDDNLSTARDMTRAVLSVSAHPTLAMMATAPEWHILRTDRPGDRWLGSTDRLVQRDDVEVLAAKTGYTGTAGYCFSAVVRTETGRTLAFTLLGAPTTGARWADADRIVRAYR
jgi:D-alanyl-D-alanine endopeptidase (penicillin-binding protein 7)